MIGSAASDLDGGVISADVCIVGAGAAGITLALAFADTPFRVCLLESGNLDFSPLPQSLYNGSIIGLDYFPLDSTRLRYFGGTTGHWGGMCGRLDPIDFRFRPWVPQSGWPLSLPLLLPYYTLAHRLCEIEETHYNFRKLETLVSAKRLPLDSRSFASRVIRYSPPTRFGEKYRQSLGRSSNIVVLLASNCLDFLVSPDGRRVMRARAASYDRKPFFIEAAIFILAAGGLENPRLLMLSRDIHYPNGIGNTNGLVGRFFMEHPHWQCGVVVPEDPDIDMTLYDSKEWRRKPGVRANAAISPSQRLQRERHLLNGIISIKPRYEDAQDTFLNDARDIIERVGEKLYREDFIDVSMLYRYFQHKKQARSLQINAMWEQSPSFESRVVLSDDKDFFGQQRIALDWRIRETDRVALRDTLELFALEIGKSGVGRMKIDIGLNPSWPGGHHHMGTTRMNQDTSFGVVDGDCCVHGMDNLYVAGSSVFPTSGAINPTLTIVALAERIADHVKARLKGRNTP